MARYKTLLPRFFSLVFIVFALVVHTPSAQGSDPVKTRLNGLGVDTTETPRTIEDPNNPNQQITLTQDYAPLGNNYTINKISELGLLNLAQSSNAGAKTSLIEDQASGGGNLINGNVESQHPQLTNYQRRFATYGDLDADGIDEIVIAYRVQDMVQNRRELHIQVLDNIENGTFTSSLIEEVYVEATTVLPTEQQQNKLDEFVLAMGDINNDDKDEIIVAICCQSIFNQAGNMLTGKRVDLRAYETIRDSSNKLLKVEVAAFQKFIANVVSAKMVYPEITVGSVDADGPMEVALVLNERTLDPDMDASPDGISRYYIIDDSSAGYTTVKNDFVSAIVGGIPRNAIVGNVATGDVDADGYDEVLLAGLTNFADDCNESTGHLYITIDDALNDFNNSRSSYVDMPAPSGCGNFPNTVRLRYVHIDTLDLNGDEIPEVQVNGIIFNGWRNGTPWTQIHELDDSNFYDNSNTYFLRSNSAMTVGDFTGDGNEDLIFFSPITSKVRVFGIQTGTNNFVEMTSRNVQFTSNETFFPMLIAPNVDNDATVLRYVGHQLIFSEPIPVAVIAAAPCDPDWGQDPDNCKASIGFSQTTGGTEEESFTLSASVTVGYSIESLFGAFGLEVSATVDAFLTNTRSTTYTRTDTVTYEPGALEDAIIFTSLPIDRYTYALVTCDSDAPGQSVDLCEPENITETTFTVDLPREPRTVQTTVPVYNSLVPPGDAVLIDSSIFDHVPGDPTSYPSATEKDAILATWQDGFQSNGILSTGQGSGSVNLTVELSEEITDTTTYGANFTFDFQATAGGVMAGFSVGYGMDKSLSIITGSSTAYSGTVSDHNIPNWSDYSYDWGLFSYVYSAVVPNKPQNQNIQQFQVLNFWTVPPSGGWEPTPTYTAEIPTATGTAPTGTPTLQPTPDGSVELLVNTSYEQFNSDTKQPDNWAGKNVGTVNKIKCNKPDKTFANSGLCAYVFKGTGAKVRLQQTISEAVLTSNGAAEGDMVRAALFASGKNLSSGGASIKMKIIYVDTTAGQTGLGKDTLKFNITLTGVNVYQPFEQSMPFDDVPRSIKFAVQFKSATGKLSIDDTSVSIPTDSSGGLMPLPLSNGRSG
jgi:hypothetical protein